jgi:hypothetical protein
MRITVKQLEAAGACRYGLSEFRRLFGAGGEVTFDRLERAMAVGLSLFWVPYTMGNSFMAAMRDLEPLNIRYTERIMLAIEKLEQPGEMG